MRRLPIDVTIGVFFALWLLLFPLTDRWTGTQCEFGPCDGPLGVARVLKATWRVPLLASLIANTPFLYDAVLDRLRTLRNSRHYISSTAKDQL